MTERILLSPPDTGPAEEEAVIRALRSGWVAPLGPEVDAFEEEMAAYTQRKYAVALSSGTAALHLALLNAGVGPGDVVLTATMTFAATANAITYTGAAPVFVDCDETGNIDVNLLDHALTDLRARRKNVAAIVPVDLLGKVANYEQIAETAARFSVPVLADSAESLGAWRNGHPAGSFGDAAVLSFNGNKVMTTSGGGMLLTDDAELARKTRYLATQARQPVVHYEHKDIGYNYRLSNILAALGRAQLSRLDSMIEKRRENRLRYQQLFDRIPGTALLGGRVECGRSQRTADNYWLTSVVLDQTAPIGAEALIRHLDDANIEARPLWKPMHLQPVFQDNTAYITGRSEQLYRNGVSLPSGSALTAAEHTRISASLSHLIPPGGPADAAP